jgi:hypothetical protein
MITINVSPGLGTAEFENDLYSTLVDLIRDMPEFPLTLVTAENEDTFRSEWV